jgi:integrase/recombinase XerD
VGPGPDEGRRTFHLELFSDFLRFERGLSDRTVRAYERDVYRLIKSLREGGVAEPAEVDVGHLREHVQALSRRGLARSSIRRARSSVRSYFGFLLQEGVIDEDPSVRLDAPRATRSLPDVLSVEEVVRVLEAPEPDHPLCWRDRAVLEFHYASGVRVSELADLRLGALDLELGLCTVFGKGSKERVVPVGSAARVAMRRYLRDLRPKLDRRGDTDAVFLTWRGRPLSRMTVWTIVRDNARRAGIDKRVSPHTLRHSCATHLLEGGADLAVVQELLGHADIATTQIYMHVDREYLREVHRTYHPRG